MSLQQLIDAFASLKVGVVGDAMLDTYLEGTSGRLCQEAPVPVVDLVGRTDVPGGAANTAANVRSLGAEVKLFSLIGDDDAGASVTDGLQARNIATDAVFIERGRATLCKTRVMAGKDMVVRVDRGDKHEAAESTQGRLVDALTEAFPGLDALILSDYRYGAITGAVVERLRELRRQIPVLIVADSKDLSLFRDIGVAAVKPNFDQAVTLLGVDPSRSPDRADLIAARASDLLAATGARLAAVTLDSEGALFIEQGRSPYRTYTRPRQGGNPSGAGDTFVAALTLCLAAGADTPQAAEVASSAAEVVVSSGKTAECSAVELRRHETFVEKFMDLDRMARRTELYRKQGRRVVFTNGCFDILHRGHVTYLNRAKRLGDVLVVGVNSDASVARLKGDSRPLNPLADRVDVLAALSCVDHVVMFDDDVPDRAILALKPDVFVKGGDYTLDMLPEADLVTSLGGKIEILPYEQGRSTTGLIRRIRGETQVST